MSMTTIYENVSLPGFHWKPPLVYVCKDNLSVYPSHSIVLPSLSKMKYSFIFLIIARLKYLIFDFFLYTLLYFYSQLSLNLCRYCFKKNICRLRLVSYNKDIIVSNNVNNVIFCDIKSVKLYRLKHA
jgi:hypothetical protein